LRITPLLPGYRQSLPAMAQEHCPDHARVMAIVKSGEL